MPKKYTKKSKLMVSVAVALVTAVLGGCAAMPSAERRAAADAAAAEIESQKAALAQERTALERERSEIEVAKMELETARNDLQSATSNTSSGTNNSGLMPPISKPGECFAIRDIRYETIQERLTVKPKGTRLEVVPAQYEIVQEQIEVKPPIIKTEHVPAKFETIQERVEVKPAATRWEVVPAVYETIEEEVVVKEATTTLKVIPARYETITEQVKVQEAGTKWVLGTSISASREVLNTRRGETGELMCLVRIDEKYELVEKQKLVSPATTEEIKSGEVTRMVARTVMKTPETMREVVIPAEYEMIEKQVLVEAATTREVEVAPAEYEYIEKTVLKEPARTEPIDVPAEYDLVTMNKEIPGQESGWGRVLCNDNSTPDIVRALQSALADKGFYRSDVDGDPGRLTLMAVEEYAKKEDLWHWRGGGGSFIAIEVIEHLGLTY